VVEAHDAEDVGPAEVEDVGDDGQVVVVDVAVGGDDLVEHRQQWSPDPGEAFGDGADRRRARRVGRGGRRCRGGASLTHVRILRGEK
jgi:hypothetical protein